MEDRRPLIIGLTIAFTAISVISVTTRLLTRAFLVKRTGADDSQSFQRIFQRDEADGVLVLIAVSLVLAIGYSSVVALCELRDDSITPSD